MKEGLKLYYRNFDEEDLLYTLHNYPLARGKDFEENLKRLFDDTPIANVEPIEFGKWIEHDNGELECSVCHDRSEDYKKRFIRCPNCGRVMLKEND